MTLKISTLSSGIRIISDSIDRVETAAVGIWVNVGSRHEPLALNGAAHFIEHMSFKGTQKRSAKDIVEHIETVGGYLNAATAREYTAFFGRALKEDIGLSIEILGDILQNSKFERHEFERERDVILQEIAQCQDTPDDIIFDHFQEAAYPSQAIGRSILGPVSSIKSMDCQSLKSFMNHHYTSSNMVIAVAGHIQHEKIFSLVERNFSNLSANYIAHKNTACYQGGEFRHQKDLEQAHIVLGFEGFSLDHPDYYAVSILATLLGGGMSSRLFQEIREKRGLAYSVYVFKSAFTDTGLFGIYVGTGSHQIPELIPVLCDELMKATHSLFTMEELNRARSQLKAGLMMGLESMTNRAEQLAQHMSFYGRPIPRAETIDRINAVSLDTLLRVAQKLFSGKPTLAALGPIRQLESYESICERLCFDKGNIQQSRVSSLNR